MATQSVKPKASIQLVNPHTGEPLSWHPNQWRDQQGQAFPFVGGVHRFVEERTYADSFGFQWNAFPRTQLDGHFESQQSRERFFAVTGWNRLDLSGENVLEVGSGAGRFSRVVLEHTQATLYSVDYSDAVEANFKNNGIHQRLKLFQASVYALPFARESFDRVFCFGVLQHTPDFRKSVQCLVDMVKPGGELVVDFYPVRGFWTKIHAKYLLRPFTRKLPPERLLGLIEQNVDWLLATSQFFHRLGVGGLNRFLPVCDVRRTLPRSLTKPQLREWAVLDTFDMFSPAYDNPQRIRKVGEWFREFGMRQVRADYVGYGPGNHVAVVKAIK